MRARLGARPATPRSTTADQLGVSEQSTGVRAAVSSHIASSGMKRRSSQKSSGEPSAGNLHAGFCLGDEFKRPRSLGEGTGAKASDNSEAPQRATASRLV